MFCHAVNACFLHAFRVVCTSRRKINQAMQEFTGVNCNIGSGIRKQQDKHVTRKIH